jgi:hypothetical protein
VLTFEFANEFETFAFEFTVERFVLPVGAPQLERIKMAPKNTPANNPDLLTF